MRGITITAAIMFALAGCSEAPTKDYYRQLSENVTMVMCGSEPEDRARALSEIVELTNGDGDSPDQARSVARRGGTECVSTCRSRGSLSLSKKQQNTTQSTTGYK